jgi:hypothetical protein
VERFGQEAVLRTLEVELEALVASRGNLLKTSRKVG